MSTPTLLPAPPTKIQMDLCSRQEEEEAGFISPTNVYAENVLRRRDLLLNVLLPLLDLESVYALAQTNKHIYLMCVASNQSCLAVMRELWWNYRGDPWKLFRRAIRMGNLQCIQYCANRETRQFYKRIRNTPLMNMASDMRAAHIFIAAGKSRRLDVVSYLLSCFRFDPVKMHNDDLVAENDNPAPLKRRRRYTFEFIDTEGNDSDGENDGGGDDGDDDDDDDDNLAQFFKRGILATYGDHETASSSLTAVGKMMDIVCANGLLQGSVETGDETWVERIMGFVNTEMPHIDILWRGLRNSLVQQRLYRFADKCHIYDIASCNNHIAAEVKTGMLQTHIVDCAAICAFSGDIDGFKMYLGRARDTGVVETRRFGDELLTGIVMGGKLHMLAYFVQHHLAAECKPVEGSTHNVTFDGIWRYNQRLWEYVYLESVAQFHIQRRTACRIKEWTKTRAHTMRDARRCIRWIRPLAIQSFHAAQKREPTVKALVSVPTYRIVPNITVDRSEYVISDARDNEKCKRDPDHYLYDDTKYDAPMMLDPNEFDM